jgi:hypothetical protein
MGHSAKRLVELLHLWDANKTNDDEEFWQIQFQSHPFAFTQLFSVPVTLIEGKAYVGGQGIDRSDARFVDFLFSGGSASEAILIEIKCPVTRLLRRGAYRENVYAPSPDLTGSVVQVADYRGSLNRELDSLNRGGKYNLAAFNPKAVVIIGNSSELDDEKKRRSFELFRSSLSNVEIVTFDEPTSFPDCPFLRDARPQLLRRPAAVSDSCRPCLVIPVSRSLPVLLFVGGVSPSHAANCRPERNREASGTLAEMAPAVIGPIPGIVTRRLVASRRCRAPHPLARSRARSKPAQLRL